MIYVKKGVKLHKKGDGFRHKGNILPPKLLDDYINRQRSGQYLYTFTVFIYTVFKYIP